MPRNLRALLLVPSVLLLTPALPAIAQSGASVSTITITGPKPAAAPADLAAANTAAPAPAANARISAGFDHTCGVTNAGRAKCWGDNKRGQLGDGTTTDQHIPVSVKGLSSGVTAVVAGRVHSCALTRAGGVKCWGRNSKGELGDGTTTQRNAPVAVKGLSSGVAAIAAGDEFTCALTKAGGVKCWGWNDKGQLGNGTTTDRHTPVFVHGLTSGVIAISASEYKHACALTGTGRVKCWGFNGNGRLGDGTTTDRHAPVFVATFASGVTAIAAGYSHSCARTSTGTAKCWGYNAAGQLGDNTTTTRLTPVLVRGGLTNAVDLAAGGAQTCARTAASGIKCWGWNAWGQVGNGTTTDRHIPVSVMSGGSAVTGGNGHTCALTNAGHAKCWGYNATGQLGDGSTTDRHAPVNVVGF